jgi:hypothetical protein
MPISERLRRHLQSHVVGYLALFVALSGTALALPGQGEVKSNDIAKGAVKGKAIAADAVSKSKLRAGSVDSTKIVDGAIAAADIGAGAVGASQLATDSVVREKIVQGTINGGKIANGAIDSAKVNNGSLLAEDFAAGQISDGFAFTAVPNFSGGTVTPFVSTPYNAPRSGRLLITASTIVNAACTGPCDDLYLALFVDGTYAPGSTVESAVGVPDGSNGTTSVTTSALVPVAAGAHTIEIRGIAANDSQGLSNEQISGVLLQ